MALIVPPNTRLPIAFSTGSGSPVSIDSSTALAPSDTSPSTGTLSPGRTATTSPGRTAAIGSSTSAPSRITRAVFGWSRESARSAAEVRRLARASRALPRRMSATIRITAS